MVFHADAGVFTGAFPNAFRILGTHATPAADPGGDPTRDPAHGLFDPACTNHTLRLGTVERWTVRTDESLAAFNHPFHLHTDQVLLTHRNGVRLDPPVWHDTLGLAAARPETPSPSWSGTRTSPVAPSPTATSSTTRTSA
ncbi:multicopper oxidase domain-containing protein [Kitasatospora arboriphila]